jgi:hypothetical protein
VDKFAKNEQILIIATQIFIEIADKYYSSLEPYFQKISQFMNYVVKININKNSLQISKIDYSSLRLNFGT